MQCFMKKKYTSLIDVDKLNVETTYFDIGLFRLQFVSSITVLLLSHSVELTSLWYGMVYLFFRDSTK